MHIYRLIPVAGPEDPNWSLSPCQGEVGGAREEQRRCADCRDGGRSRFSRKRAKPAEGVSTASASAFRNEKLYTVIEDISGQYPGEGPRAVLSGSFNHKVILPLVARDP